MRILIAIAAVCITAAQTSCIKRKEAQAKVPVIEESWVEILSKDENGEEMYEAINYGDIEFLEISEYNAQIVHRDLIGGTEADPKDWPASFATTNCTATLLGPKVLQTAAHCVGNGRTASLRIDGTSRSATCTHHPSYSRNSTADFALCVFKEAIEREWYEKVMTEAEKDKLAIGKKLRLAGVGCTKPGGGGAKFGTFRTGEATITRLPSTSNFDTVTRGGAALCYGDSGGSAFYEEGEDRWVIGVNSRGNIYDTSYLSSVYTNSAQTFYRDWAADKGVVICGIHSEAEKCQGSGEKLPPLPEHCKSDYDHVGECVFKRIAREKPESCKDAYAKISICLDVAQKNDDSVE